MAAGNRAAIRYAKAVLDLAQDKNVAEVVNNTMSAIASTIAGSKALNDVLHNSVIKSAMKKEALLKIFPNLDALTQNLLDVLITNKRLHIIGYVAKNYQELYDKQQGIVEAKVTTAVPLTEALTTKVLAKVKTLTGSDKVAIQNVIDDSILGGFILRVGDIQYNASISNQLNKLKKEFTLN